MNALPSFTRLMQAQARPHGLPISDAQIRTEGVTEVIQRRKRLGLAMGLRMKATAVAGVHYEYHTRKHSRIREFLVIERKAKPIDFVHEEGEYTPAWRIIIAEVAEKHGLQPKQLRNNGRSAGVILARQEACFRIWRVTPLSQTQIASKLGYADHTTVSYSIKRHKQRLLNEAGEK